MQVNEGPHIENEGLRVLAASYKPIVHCKLALSSQGQDPVEKFADLKY